MKNRLHIFMIGLALPLLTSGASGDVDDALKPGTPGLKEAWSTGKGLSTPESVLYDRKGSRIFVSNMAGDKPGDGFISILGKDGEVLDLRFSTGLNDPKGLGLFGNRLYVADVDRVVVLSAESGEILNQYPVPEARFLNDVAVDPFGIVYISDTMTNKVHKIENGYLRTACESEHFQRPNGLYVVDPVTLLMVTAQGGVFGRLNVEKAVLDKWVDGIPQGDGIARDRFGNYFVSSWSGRIFYVYPAGKKVELLDTTGKGMNTADIDIIPEDDILLVPTFNDNRVVAYSIDYPDQPGE